MATCEGCEATIVWLQRAGGGWLPPFEPASELAGGDYVAVNDQGVAVFPPTIYKRHHCPSPLDPAESQRRRLEREEKRRQAEEERERLIIEDRARRAAAAELEAQRIEAERIVELERAVVKNMKRDYDYALRAFKPRRLLPIPCRDCGAEEGQPCLDLRTAEVIERYEAQGRHEEALGITWGWYNRTAHTSRFQDGPPAAQRPKTERWGEDYKGPWPPRKSDPGRHEMRNWLAQNFEIFDPDGYRNRDWLMPAEVIDMTRWLRKHAQLLTGEEEDDGDGLGEVAVVDGIAGLEGPG